MKPSSSPNGHAARRTLSGVLPIVHVPFDVRDQIDAADQDRQPEPLPQEPDEKRVAEESRNPEDVRRIDRPAGRPRAWPA
jgi:hypothetical protein